ncbi:Hypothetical protein SMAX5B_015195 [Scophthalmus maximus]|uniref:Uncharacterized protein n=1 Tax=Scophthalmus maximus TaxID=52904 RepID=A0A2U9CEK9_SCOMX|nr:Hypothetical protein SMAX5B_015195 [Scophthalmus maximus]
MQLHVSLSDRSVRLRLRAGAVHGAEPQATVFWKKSYEGFVHINRGVEKECQRDDQHMPTCSSNSVAV